MKLSHPHELPAPQSVFDTCFPSSHFLISVSGRKPSPKMTVAQILLRFLLASSKEPSTRDVLSWTGLLAHLYSAVLWLIWLCILWSSLLIPKSSQVLKENVIHPCKIKKALWKQFNQEYLQRKRSGGDGECLHHTGKCSVPGLEDRVSLGSLSLDMSNPSSEGHGLQK